MKKNMIKNTLGSVIMVAVLVASAVPIISVTTDTQVVAATKSTTQQKIDSILLKLKDVNKREKANDLKEDKLEKDYRAKKITKTEYRKQMKALDIIDDKIDDEEDALELQLKNLKYSKYKDTYVTASDKEVSSILSQLKTLNEKEKANDLKEDKLERDYRANKISRTEFNKQMAALEIEDDKLDRQEDALERQLKQLNYTAYKDYFRDDDDDDDYDDHDDNDRDDDDEYDD